MLRKYFQGSGIETVVVQFLIYFVRQQNMTNLISFKCDKLDEGFDYIKKWLTP